jgi:3-demethoxyubiquinol 3-hydroxylase
MPTPNRSYSLLDQLCLQAEQGLRLWAGVNSPDHRANPADNHPEALLSQPQREHIAALFRVNHTGEVCAQALYFGQALLARTPELRSHLHQAALEEGDHLRWCESRVRELGAKTSVFNPGFYTLSVLIGMFAACLGDKISLGFIAATESQVEQHLQSHLDQLPIEDERSRAMILQMQADETTHGNQALARGGEILPEPVQAFMRQVSRLMTGLAYRG